MNTLKTKRSREGKLRKIRIPVGPTVGENRSGGPGQNVETQQNAVVVFFPQSFDLITPCVCVWVSFWKKSEVLVTEQAIDVETSDPKS